MKKFSYSLEGVLRVRLLQEDQARAEVARTIVERNEMIAKVREFQEEIVDCRKRLCGVGIVTARDFTQTQKYIKGLSTQVLELTIRADHLNLKIENLKKELHAKIIETRKLETHKGNEKSTWRLENQRSEQAEFDEIASARRHLQK